MDDDYNDDLHATNMKSTQRAVAVDLCLHHLRMTLRQSYLILEKLFSSQMMNGQAWLR